MNRRDNVTYSQVTCAPATFAQLADLMLYVHGLRMHDVLIEKFDVQKPYPKPKYVFL